jgi:ribosome-associated protein
VRREGVAEARWVLLDFVDVVVHVQHAEERAYYALERLWKDCPTIPFVDSALPPTDGARNGTAGGDGAAAATGSVLLAPDPDEAPADASGGTTDEDLLDDDLLDEDLLDDDLPGGDPLLDGTTGEPGDPGTAGR